MSKFGNDDIANFLHQISVMSFLSYSYRLWIITYMDG
jgi:hypothetical protein